MEGKVYVKGVRGEMLMHELEVGPGPPFQSGKEELG